MGEEAAAPAAPAPSTEAPANDNATTAPAQPETPKTEAPSEYLTDADFAALKGRKYKTKIDGKDTDVTFDEVFASGQKASSIERAARARMEEAARIRKNTEKFAEDLERDWFATIARAHKHDGDPIQLIEKTYGKDVARQYAEAYVARLIEEESLPVEEKRARAAQAEAARYKQEADNLRSERQREKANADRQAKIAEYQKTFPEALQRLGIKPNQYAIARMAHHGAEKNARREAWTAEELAEMVKKDIDGEMAEHRAVRTDRYLSAGEKILEVLREDFGEKADEIRRLLREAEVRAVKVPPSPPPVTPPRDPSTGQFTPKKDASNPNGYVRLEALRDELLGG